jgi:hypothetical protein
MFAFALPPVKREAVVILYAGPVRASLLDLGDELPEGPRAPEASALAGLMRGARKAVETL